MAFYRIHSIKLHTEAMGAAVILADVISQDNKLDPQMRADITAGNNSPTHVALVSRKPMLSAATFALAQFLDAVGVAGLGVHAGTNPGVVAYFQKVNDDGIPESSGHRSLTYALGVLVPRSLSANHGEDFRINFDLHVLGDGTNAPVTISDSATLPTISQASERWTLGPIKIGNVALTKYSGVEIDFGNDVQTRGNSSFLDPTHAEAKPHSPKITITGIDPTWFSGSNVPVGGKAVLNASDYVYLRKRAQDGDNFVANGTSGHIKLVLSGLAAIGQAGRAEAMRTSETTLQIVGAKDSSGNAPIVLTTGTTIS
jgi:hypothetical protein